MYKNISRLSLLCFTLAHAPSYSCDPQLEERELSIHHLTASQRDVLNEKVAQNVKLYLNKTFTSGETMINLMDTYSLGVQIFQTPSGELETRYTVMNGWTCTLKDSGYGIAAYMDKPEKLRVTRFDGRYARQDARGNYDLGRLYYRDAQPVKGSPNLIAMPITDLRTQVKRDLEANMKQRRPEELRDKKFSHRTQVDKKPDQEDVRLIQEKQIQSREEKFNQLSAQVSELRLDVLTTPEQAIKIKSFNLTLEMLKKNINNEQNFNVLLDNAQAKYTELNKESNEVLRQILAEKPSSSTSSQPSLMGENQERKEIKEQTDLRIKEKEEKEKSHQERPNANPLGGVVETQDEDLSDDAQGNTGLYIFNSIPRHWIIDALQGTSNEDSSYIGISISREQLQNFVEFLEQAERDECIINGSAEVSDLGYFYNPKAGKGSHLKVKFGRGTKPVILSDQGRLLIVAQMRDVKDALIQKGLIK